MFESICNDRFFLSAFRPRTDIKNKTVTRCYAARHRFFQTRSLPAFSLSSGKLWWFFFNKNCFAYFAYFAPWCNFSSSSLWSTRLEKWALTENRGGVEAIVLHQPWWPYALGIILIPEFHRVPKYSFIFRLMPIFMFKLYVFIFDLQFFLQVQI